jgi:hypothetical protein
MDGKAGGKIALKPGDFGIPLPKEARVWKPGIFFRLRGLGLEELRLLIRQFSLFRTAKL